MSGNVKRGMDVSCQHCLLSPKGERKKQHSERVLGEQESVSSKPLTPPMEVLGCKVQAQEGDVFSFPCQDVSSDVKEEMSVLDLTIST